MQYRPFRPGFDISALGFGAMRLPTCQVDGKDVYDHDAGVALLRHAFDQGVNYVDTAPGYCNRESEIIVGKAVKGYRDRVRVSTKYGTDECTPREMRSNLETSLKKLDLDYIDFYHFWGIDYEQFSQKIKPNGALDEALRAKSEGLIRNLSFSFHGSAESLISLVDTGLFDSLLCQYNLLDRALEQALQYAHDRGMGTVVMGPLAGGRLGAPSPQIAALLPGNRASSVSTALRFVLSHPGVSCALSGMGTMQMVDDNVATASLESPLTDQERAAVIASLQENQKLADLYCTGCRYCQPCPAHVNIPYIFDAMNNHRIYGLTDYARGEYSQLGEGKKQGMNATACVNCGLCEKKCPQRIAIRQQLRQAHEVLGTAQ